MIVSLRFSWVLVALFVYGNMFEAACTALSLWVRSHLESQGVFSPCKTGRLGWVSTQIWIFVLVRSLAAPDRHQDLDAETIEFDDKAFLEEFHRWEETSGDESEGNITEHVKRKFEKAKKVPLV